MKIEFSHKTLTANKKICKSVADTLCAELSQTAKLQTDINFVSETEIRSLNKTFRNKDSVTDTLSFPFINLAMCEKIDSKKHHFQRDPLTKRILLGEIYLNTDKIQKQADEYGHSFNRELAYLTAHSLLHLFGYGHDNPDDEKLMTNLAETITQKAGFPK